MWLQARETRRPNRPDTRSGYPDQEDLGIVDSRARSRLTPQLPQSGRAVGFSAGLFPLFTTDAFNLVAIFSGATLDLAVTNLVSNVPLLRCHLIYMQAPKAFSDASEKTHNVGFPVAYMGGVRHRSSSTISRSFISSNSVSAICLLQMMRVPHPSLRLTATVSACRFSHSPEMLMRNQEGKKKKSARFY